MRAIHRSALLVLILFLGIVACALPGVNRLDPNTGGTSIAQTLVAIIEATQSAAFSPTPPGTFTATVTFTNGLPTRTPTETVIASSLFSPTPFLVQISVSVPTNCRNGPGIAYLQVGALPVGKTVRVYARDPTGKFWYIQNPYRPNEFCWVSGVYATVTGLTSILPIYTPPPTPTATFTPIPLPDFDASYSGKVTCNGWWPEIKLRNTGTVTFKSVGIILMDTVTSTTASNITDGFIDNPDCSSTNSRSTLPPGKAVNVSAPVVARELSRHQLRATITLCSDKGQNGLCVTQSITFQP